MHAFPLWHDAVVYHDSRFGSVGTMSGPKQWTQKFWWLTCSMSYRKCHNYIGNWGWRTLNGALYDRKMLMQCNAMRRSDSHHVKDSMNEWKNEWWHRNFRESLRFIINLDVGCHTLWLYPFDLVVYSEHAWFAYWCVAFERNLRPPPINLLGHRHSQNAKC
jgi:hypothetical protein